MIILEGGMEPPKVPVFAKEGHCLGLHGSVRPKGRQKEVGGGRTLQLSGPGSKCAKSRVSSWPLHMLFFLSGIHFLQLHPARSSSALGLSLDSGTSSREPPLIYPPPSSTHTRAGAPLGFPQCPEALPLQLCSI